MRKVVVDTNLLRAEGNKDILGNLPKRLYDFIQVNNLSHNTVIALPRVVIEEMVQSRLESINHKLETTEEFILELKELGISLSLSKGYDEDDVRSRLLTCAENEMKKFSISTIFVTTSSRDELIKRAIHKITPFSDRGVGFKDTLIWLSILDEAITNKSVKYLFLSKDSIFNLDQINRELIDRGIDNVEVLFLPSGARDPIAKIDEYLELGNHLIANNEIIRQKILSKIGTLTLLFNRKVLHREMGYFSLVEVIPYSQAQKGNLTGYDIKELSVLSIKHIGSNRYSVQLNVSVLPVYEKDKETQYPYQLLVKDFEFSEDYSVSIIFDDILSIIEIESAKKSFDFIAAFAGGHTRRTLSREI